MSDLSALQVRWALVGGLAVAIHGELRTTRDIDIAVAVSNENEASAVVLGLRGRGYRDHPGGAVIEHPDGRLATVRLISPPEGETGVVVDLLFASSGVEAEVVEAAQQTELIRGLVAPVVRAGHLLALKVLAARTKDLEDARLIVKQIDPGELQRARDTLLLISERGFSRARKLMEQLDQVIAAAADPEND